MKNFWVAHVRGADFDQLKKTGFLTFFPSLDDYVFLEVKEENQHLLRRQSELNIHFLKKGSDYTTVEETELDYMTQETKGKIIEGTDIQVVKGYCANLDGIVLEVEEELARCYLNGYNRKYKVELDISDIVAQTDLTMKAANAEKSTTG